MKPKAGASQAFVTVAAGTITIACFLILVLTQLGACATDDARVRQVLARASYPPPPQLPRVVALGNLRSGPPPSDTSVRLSILLFGEEPEPPLAFIRPLSIGLDRGGLLVCDAALGAVLRWDSRATELKLAKLSPRPARPVAAEIAPNGDILIADARNEAVYRYDPSGQLKLQYALPTGKIPVRQERDREAGNREALLRSRTVDGETGTSQSPGESGAMRSPSSSRFRPASVLSVGDEIWVTNVLGHRIEIFDAATGQHRRAIGTRGGEPGEFGAPLGMARMPDGSVCVVDTLNARVQVFDAEGKFVRQIGGPGDLVGYFGRPKDVAVGPDGTVFVTDAASQRVHAFDAEGRALLAFPELARSASDARHVGTLSVPGGVCVSTSCPIQDPVLPDGFEPEYFVLVAEQLLRPGIRVYAWGRSPAAADADSAERAREAARPKGPEQVANPHWSATSCNACHVMEAGSVHPRHQLLAGAARSSADVLCLSCHDGVKAHVESHPIGRLAITESTTVPIGWPLVEDRLGCLTCHDIVRHCNADARRPSVNPAMLRAFDAADPMHLCVQCHQSSETWRVSPHRHLDAVGRVMEESCTFCHIRTPPIPADGARRHDPMLHADGSQLCLTCHTRHWDVSPQGHVDRTVSEHTRRVMLARQFAHADGNSNQPDAQSRENGTTRTMPRDLTMEPALLPLSANRVTCYTCHNPHQPGLFPDNTPLGAFSAAPRDTHAALRISSDQLCIECHAK